MNLQTLSAFEQMTLWSPMPWYMESDNDSGLEVKDSTGRTVFAFDAGAIPDEWPSHMREEETAKQKALGRFLLALSRQYTPIANQGARTP